MKRIIYEMPVYCGRLKEWRVLNLTTGTVYSNAYESESEAASKIQHLEARGDATVQRVTLFDVRLAVASTQTPP